MATFFVNVMLFWAFIVSVGSWALGRLLGPKGKTRFLNGLASVVMRFLGM